MSIRSWFCKHNWKRISSEKIIKRKTLKEFWPTDLSEYGSIELSDYTCLEYEVLSETFVCENCGGIKHFVS